MKTIKKTLELIKKIFVKNSLFKRNKSEANNLLCGIGESEITENEIVITNYPFEPSIVYPDKSIKAHEIDSICIDYGICRIYAYEDIIFITAEKKDELKKFAENHTIKLSKYSWNWDWILEPYLDTEFSSENEQLVSKRLHENGITKSEVNKLRKEVGKQMYKYNFDTMLWDWSCLGLSDVLSAMRVKYNKEEFRFFYNRAIEIDKRNKNITRNKI